MSRRRGLLGELSWFQVLGGALAAMTSAWIASTLGVAGTIIGAAVGSLVLTTSSAFYTRTLDKGRTLIVQTDRGTVVERPVEPGEVGEALDEVADVTDSPVRSAEVVETPPSGLPWRRIALTSAIVLVVALLAMGAYEQISGNPYGAGSDNTRITNPFGGSAGSSDEEPAPEPTDPVAPTESVPTPDPTATPSPTTTAPTPDPTAGNTASPPAPE